MRRYSTYIMLKAEEWIAINNTLAVLTFIAIPISQKKVNKWTPFGISTDVNLKFTPKGRSMKKIKSDQINNKFTEACMSLYGNIKIDEGLDLEL